MIKCDNCDKPAEYTCADPGVNPVNYCTECLPKWLRDRASLGHFTLAVAKEPTKTSKKKEPVEEVKAEEEVPANESN